MKFVQFYTLSGRALSPEVSSAREFTAGDVVTICGNRFVVVECSAIVSGMYLHDGRGVPGTSQAVKVVGETAWRFVKRETGFAYPVATNEQRQRGPAVDEGPRRNRAMVRG